MLNCTLFVVQFPLQCPSNIDDDRTEEPLPETPPEQQVRYQV